MPSPADLDRVDSTRLRYPNTYDIDVSVFANEEVPIERAAIEELDQMLGLQGTVETFAKASPESFQEPPRIERVALTPDFHKARGIPVGTVLQTSGFVVPQAIGNDINCGMRLHVTNVDATDVVGHLDELETECRRVYFEAGRNIPMNSSMRESLFLGGIDGLYQTVGKDLDEGLWNYFHRCEKDATLARIEQCGTLPANRVWRVDNMLGDSATLSRDSQIGSIGGGNHFVEFQRVEKIIDGQVAHAWGLTEGMLAIMVHTGSVSVGAACGSFYRDKVRDIFPDDVRHPDNGIFPLPFGEKHAETAAIFWDAMHNAANFAFANRMFLALMAWESLENCLGEVACDLLYDAPHNMVWKQPDGGIVHRKGACPARGYDAMKDTPFQYYGEPVLVPGSMGASSFILAGNGFAGTVSSAAHGAGRAISRGKAMKGFDREFEKFLQEFRVVTPLDFRRQDVKQRRDIIAKKLSDLKQEAPFAYKGIGPVIQTITDAAMARPVAKLTPIMTVKG